MVFAEWTGARLHIAHKSSKDALTGLAAKIDDQLKQFKAAHPNW